MDKKAKLPNRQTFVNPAGLRTKSEVFGIFVSDIYLLSDMLSLRTNCSAKFKLI
jgi:hypothetical protein